MSILVVADHDNETLNGRPGWSMAAAAKIGGDVDVLVAGENCKAVAEAAAKVPGVARCCWRTTPPTATLAENLPLLVVDLAADYSHVMTAHTTVGRNFLPRVAALLDVAQISDIIEVVSEDTFKRPIYAGNAIATVKSNDAKKVVSVRGTSYDPVTAEGGSASIEEVSKVHDAGSPAG
jgi:electron transfer flavoprotein alpha subunit